MRQLAFSVVHAIKTAKFPVRAEFGIGSFTWAKTAFSSFDADLSAMVASLLVQTRFTSLAATVASEDDRAPTKAAIGGPLKQKMARKLNVED